MAKKRIAAVFAVCIGCVAAFALSACDFLTPVAQTPYEVASELGYDGSEADWIAAQSGAGTGWRQLYAEAVAEGYEGSFTEFLKELGVGAATDDTAAVNLALNSVVSIDARFSVVDGRERKAVSSLGAGVIYALDREEGDAYIITNYHVVYNADSVGTETVSHVSDTIYVCLYGSEGADSVMQATYVGGVMNYDLAVLAIEGDDTVSYTETAGSRSHTNKSVLAESSARTIVAGNSDALTVGERAYAIGNPEGEGISVTQGTVSVVSEYIDIVAADGTTELYLPEIRTDAAVNHGNSGGGLFDAEGRFIGTVNARSEASGVEAFGYALPGNLVLSVAQNIIDNRTDLGAARATLGITIEIASGKAVYNEADGKTYLMQTVVVKSVMAGTFAYGKLQAGDVIYSMEILSGSESVIEQVVTLRPQVDAVLFNVRLGNTLELTVSRGGEILTVPFLFDDVDNFTLLQ